MDHLKICMDALRLLARLPEFDTNRLYLAEQRIKEYLQSEAHRPLTASLEHLTHAIGKEVAMGDKTYWTTVQEFVDTLLRNESGED